MQFARHFVTVLLGFIQCEERRTLRGLLRQVAGVRAFSPLSRFFAQGPWAIRCFSTTCCGWKQTMSVKISRVPNSLRAARRSR